MVYPFTDGQSFRWGEWSTEVLDGVTGLLARVHLAPEQARRYARTDDFGVPFRELTEAALSGWEPDEHGPYTRLVARLLREYAGPVRRWLDQYDGLVAEARHHPARFFRPHGQSANDVESWELLSSLIRQSGR